MTSIVIVIFILAFHLLLLSNNPDLVVTELAVINPDDRLTTFYSQAIQGPIDEAFGSDILGMLSTAILWGVVGWVVYSLTDFVFGNIAKIRKSSKEISSPMSTKVVRHPLRNQLLVRLMWRFFIGLCIALWTIFTQPYVVEIFQRDLMLLTSDSVQDSLIHATFIFGGWLAIFHVYVLLFRFFVLRTRFFGEIIY